LISWTAIRKIKTPNKTEKISTGLSDCKPHIIMEMERAGKKVNLSL
jgi:hypothetical protein